MPATGKQSAALFRIWDFCVFVSSGVVVFPGVCETEGVVGLISPRGAAAVAASTPARISSS